MQNFSLYFELGWQHILDWQGYDHILFITVLCGIYLLKEWRKILILVTAFTFGHTLTLALSIFNIIIVPSKWVEFLIPITILATALYNIKNKHQINKKMAIPYTLALIFGLVHGLGFSNYLKSLMGKSNNVVAELFAFNIGLEFGQIIIVLSILILSFLAINIAGVKKRDWHLFISSVIFGIALMMAIDRIPKL